MRKLGFGLVGTGAIAPYHINAINTNKNASLIGIFSSTRSRAKRLAKKFNVKYYSSYVGMLKDKVLK